MPESKVRDQAAKKKAAKNKAKAADAKMEKSGKPETGSRKASKKNKRQRMPLGRDWVPWVFVPMALLGVLWLLLFYIAGTRIPLIKDLQNWNYLIGIGLIAASFFVATLWK